MKQESTQAKLNNQIHINEMQKELIKQLKEKLHRVEEQLKQSYRAQAKIAGGKL